MKAADRFTFYHETLTPQVNACPPRSYYVPFPDKNFDLRKEKSAQITLLSKWKFAYFARFTGDLVDFEPTEEFDVPFMWQVKGFDYDQYANYYYPFPFDPPYIRKDNPCGIYTTEYDVTEEGQKHYLVFEGVDSCLYLFVNNGFVGYSTVSHSTAEFDVTDFLHSGTNKIKAIVLKWCSGSYLEDQDKLRMSGIFRDVYVLRRPQEHIGDFRITTDVNGREGIIRFSCDKAAEVCLYDGEKPLFSAIGPNVEFHVRNAALWSAETPKLYRLVISYNGEFIEEFAGIRKIEIDGTRFLLNGKAIKLKGVNRHSMTAEGYVESLEIMEKDLAMFREFNINSVRTSHYPPHPLFTRLCDIYGVYVVEECDLESHGLETIHYYNDSDHFDDLAEDPAWLPVYLHRQKRMFERDKNRPSVIMWSLGNEAGWGNNFKECAGYLHTVDTRPVHYEGNASRTWPDVEFRDPEILDVASLMYKEVSECRARIEKGIGKPFMLCEYTHAMGNSCGDAKEYWDYIYAEEGFLGAFVWEWCDHTRKTADGRILFGGDFGEREPCGRYEGNFCVDGLVDTDRRPHPSLFEIKQVYAPVDVLFENGVFSVFNRYDFLSLGGLTCYVTRSVNGEEKARLTCDLRGIYPKKTRSLPLEGGPLGGYETVDFSFLDGEGREVAHRQFVLSDDLCLRPLSSVTTVIKKDGEYLLAGKNYRARIDHRGMISSLFSGGEFFKKPATLCLYRAPIDNDLPSADEWARLRLAYVNPFATDFSVCGGVLTVKGVLVADIVEPLFDFEIRYTAREDSFCVELTAKKHPWVTEVARFGFRFVLNGDFTECEYFGRAGESYPDRFQNCPVGRYTIGPRDGFSYTKPQDSGNRSNCRKVEISGLKRRLSIESGVDFNFTLSPWEIADYARHAWEMPEKTDKTVLHLDAFVAGVGSAACGAPLAEKYRVKADEISMKFEVFPEGPSNNT